MYIKFDKVSEDDTTVTYRLETEVLDVSSKTIKHIFVKALCIFDKKNESISFDPDKTHPYYFRKNRESIHILHYLVELNHLRKPFPDIYDIVTC